MCHTMTRKTSGKGVSFYWMSFLNRNLRVRSKFENFVEKFANRVCLTHSLTCSHSQDLSTVLSFLSCLTILAFFTFAKIFILWETRVFVRVENEYKQFFPRSATLKGFIFFYLSRIAALFVPFSHEIFLYLLEYNEFTWGETSCHYCR